MKFLDKLFLPDKRSMEYNIDRYIKDLENGAFLDHMNLGLIEKNGGIEVNLQRFEKSPNALYIGAMGSGKSVAANFSILTWMLANSHQSILFIIDTLKGANDYQELFEFEQVYPVLSSEVGVHRVIDLLYDEAIERRNAFNEYQAENIFQFEEKSKKKISRIITLMEEFHSIPYIIMDFDRNYKVEGTTAFKFYQLMKIGRSYGIWFVACSQKATKSDVPSEIVPNFTQKQIFRVSKAEAAYFLGDTKASEIRTDQKGRCETDYGPVQFPYVPMATQKKLLDKYMKPLATECCYLTPKLIKDYIGGHSTEELYKLKKLSDLCKGIESFDPDLVITILHKKLGHKLESIDSKIDPSGISLISDWGGKVKCAIGIRVKAKLSNKHILKLRKGMQEYNCPRGIIYTSQEDLPQSLYKLAVDNQIEIVDHEDLIKLARQIEANKAEDLTPDRLADDSKESGSYQDIHHIPNKIVDDEDENAISIGIDKDVQSKYIKPIAKEEKKVVIDEKAIINVEEPVEKKAKKYSDTYETNVQEIDDTEADEETKQFAERMMLKQYKGNVKPLKRVPVRGFYEFPKDRQPIILARFEKNITGSIYRFSCFIIDNSDKKIIHKFFVDRQVETEFSEEELLKLEITGTNDWNAYFDKINNRTTLTSDKFDKELLVYFEDNLKNYDLGNIPVMCWAEDESLVKKITEKCKVLRRKPQIFEELYEANFGESMTQAQLLNLHADKVKRNDIFTPLEKDFEIFKIVL